MWMTLGLLGFFGSFLFLVMTIVSVFRKNGQTKKHLTIAVICVIVFLVAAFVDRKPVTTSVTQSQNATSEQTTKDEVESKTKDEVESEAKAEAEAKANAEQEATAKAETEARAKAQTETEKKAEQIPGTIGMTPEQFKTAFNKVAAEYQSDLIINNITITEGVAQNTFQYMFTKNLGIIGTVNKKDGSVREVLLMGAGDGTVKSGADILIGMGILITATNPDLSDVERGNVLRELGVIDGGDIMDLNKSTVRNGIRYKITTSVDLGIWFSAIDANEKK